MKKRQLLKSIGASIFVADAGTAAGKRESTPERPSPDERPVGTAGAGNDEGLPVYAAGKMIHEYERDGEEFVRRKTFESPALRERYGDPVIEYEPERYHERLLSDAVREGRRTRFTGRTRRVIGTAEEHDVAEQRIWRQAREESVSGSVELDDKIPLYHYESASDAASQYDRKAPINVSWDWESASDVETRMENGVGSGDPWVQSLPLPEEPRYVNDDGTVRSTAAHVMDSIGFCWPTQYHIRLYDVDADGVEAVGQAHRDPCNHNQGIKIDDWEFDETRWEVEDWWKYTGYRFNTTSDWVGNTDPAWDTHAGFVTHVYTIF